MNIMADLDGKIYWSYTAAYIDKSSSVTTSNLAYTQCSFDLQDYVYSLLHITDLKHLVLVKQEYLYGQYVYSKRIPGEY